MLKTKLFDRKFIPLAACVMLAAFCIVPAAYSQNTGGVKGRVRNMAGAGLAGATITARQNGVDGRSTKANEKGFFQLYGLEQGVYNLVVEAKGYSAGVQYNVEIKKGKMRDIGDRLILTVDRGTLVIVYGSVFFKEGTSASGAKVEIYRVNSDGSEKKLAETMTGFTGEFSFRQPEGPAKLRFKATLKNGTGTKDLDVDSAQIYRLSVKLDVERNEK